MFFFLSLISYCNHKSLEAPPASAPRRLRRRRRGVVLRCRSSTASVVGSRGPPVRSKHAWHDELTPRVYCSICSRIEEIIYAQFRTCNMHVCRHASSMEANVHVDDEQSVTRPIATSVERRMYASSYKTLDKWKGRSSNRIEK